MKQLHRPRGNPVDCSGRSPCWRFGPANARFAVNVLQDLGRLVDVRVPSLVRAVGSSQNVNHWSARDLTVCILQLQRLNLPHKQMSTTILQRASSARILRAAGGHDKDLDRCAGGKTPLDRGSHLLSVAIA